MSVLDSEGRFVAASPRCPHPEYWHSRDEWSTEHEVSVLLAGLVRGLQPDLVVETGTAFGETAKLIGEALAENGHGLLVTCEIVEDRVEDARRLLGELPVHVFHGEAVDYTPQNTIGFLFLDSSWEDRRWEFEHFSAWLKPGSIVAIHDVAEPSGFRDDIVWMLERYPVKTIDLPTPRGLMLIQVMA